MRRLLRHLERPTGRLRQWASFVSPFGRVVVVAGAVCWAGAVWWGWAELAVLASTAWFVLLIAIAYTIGQLDLEARIGVDPPRVVVGERAAGSVGVTNRRSRTARGFRVELPVGRAVAVFDVPSLGPDGTTEELFVVPTNRRAVIPVGPLTSVQGDPLGLMRREQRWTGVERIHVHPRTVVLSAIAAGLIRDLEGQTTSALSPSDVAFHTLREYVRGDDLRHVHWKSSAKIGELMVRQYNDTRRSHIAVLLSIDPDEYGTEDEFELGISCAASVAVQALRDDQTLSMIIGGTQVPSTDPTALLDRFSEIEGVAGVGGIEASLRTARRSAADASVAVLCVGSRLGVAEIRRATSRTSLETNHLVLRADLDGRSGYRVVGQGRFLDVPDLDQLARGLVAVMS